MRTPSTLEFLAKIKELEKRNHVGDEAHSAVKARTSSMVCKYCVTDALKDLEAENEFNIPAERVATSSPYAGWKVVPKLAPKPTLTPAEIYKGVKAAMVLLDAVRWGISGALDTPKELSKYRPWNFLYHAQQYLDGQLILTDEFNGVFEEPAKQ